MQLANTVKNAAGFTLLEVLVAMVVSALGLLGVLALFVRNGVVQVDSLHRKAASELSLQIAERMRGNPSGFSAGNYVSAMPPVTTGQPAAITIPTCALPTSCTPAEIAARDIAQWQIDVRSRLAGAGTYLTASPNGDSLQIVIAWAETRPTGEPGALLTCPAALSLSAQFKCVASQVYP